MQGWAQTPPPPLPTPAAPEAAPDPAAALPPLPDLGIPWPEAAAPPADPAAAAPDTDAVVGYRTETEGFGATGIDADFRQLSTLRTSRGPANLAQIALRARADEDLLVRLLRARGYYGAVVASRITPAPAAGGTAIVTLSVTPGELYRWGAITVTPQPPVAATIIARDALGLRAGDPVDAARAIAARENVILQLPNRGFPFARVGEADIVVDHDARRGAYGLGVVPGRRARFGRMTISGRPDVGGDHLRVIARFREGNSYDQSLVDDLRRALVQTTLFSSVAIRPVERVRPDGDADADLDIAVTPAKLRTVAGEAGYDTIDGFRVEASWRHRNLINPEGALTVRGVYGTREQSLSTDLVLSNWRQRDQTLAGRIRGAYLDTPAFRSTVFDANARIERRTTLLFQKPWTYSLGVEIQASSERDRSLADNQLSPERREFVLLALPLQGAYDRSDDVLDPRRGYRLAGRASPEFDVLGQHSYLRLRFDGSAYVPLGSKLVAAGRLAVGSISGADRDDIAPSRRYYVGGGGSVRGYGFQDIGPKDVNNRPTGGRALAEFSIEGRYRVSETIGVVPFLDGGRLDTGQFPTFTGFRYGAGLGARYYSSFGPIRIDVATPLNPTRGDPKVALYVSIGQSF